jgi:hypothetical protein
MSKIVKKDQIDCNVLNQTFLQTFKEWYFLSFLSEGHFNSFNYWNTSENQPIKPAYFFPQAWKYVDSVLLMGEHFIFTI